MSDATKNDNKAFWQRMAKFYAPFMKSSDELYDAAGCKIEKYISNDMDVLELACGSGQFSYRLASFAHTWEATDFSEKMIKQAEMHNKVENLRFSVQDATQLSYRDSSFNAVLIANALHIMPEPDKALDEIYRVLKPKGLLFAPTFVHGEGYSSVKSKLLGIIGFKTYNKWSADGIVQYAADRGFDVIEADVLDSSFMLMCNLIARKK